MDILNNNIVIRGATPQDAESIHRLYCNTVKALDKESYTEEQIHKWASLCGGNEQWKQRIAADQYIVATSKDEVLDGFCSLQCSGCIDMLYVSSSYQRKGIGTCLLHALYDLADKTGIANLYVNSSLAAATFFEQNGFCVQDVSSMNMDGVHFTNVRVAKRLLL